MKVSFCTCWILSLIFFLKIYVCNGLKIYPKNSPYTFKVRYFDSLVDHFSFTDNRTFRMKYLINTDYWDKQERNAVFFYTGNEGSIELFAQNTGFLWETAKKVSALIIFAEHRYYGESMPFGNKSFSDPNHFGYLTAEQALADYASLINNLTMTIEHFRNKPIIAFGGSYGGMLAAWMRQKYPNLISGAIAASAPVWNFEGITPCNGYNFVLTRAFDQSSGSTSCSNNIRNLWSILVQYGKSAQGLTILRRLFRVCDVLKSSSGLSNYINSALSFLGMGNYPYPADFVGDFPAWPVKEFCRPLNKNIDPKNTSALLTKVAEALQVYTNHSGHLKCLNLSGDGPVGLDSTGWNLQTCLEMVMPMCSNGKTDMFPFSAWNFTVFSDSCWKQFGVRPRNGWIQTQFWGAQINAASKILFSNGYLDPWSAGGVVRAVSSSLPIIMIPNGAHHVDLRASNPLDPPDIIEARQIELSYIRLWIKEWVHSIH